jgi:hypothetical protein
VWVYADYIEVKKDFIPVFSEEVDREQPQGWKSFIPHKGLRDILVGLIKAFERGSSADKLSLWVHGAYGTGKTFAAFVLKHLLEDPLDEVEDYFSNQSELRNLWPRFKSLRERGPYIVVYRSSSDHITSSLKLLVEIQQAVKETLKEKGYPELVGETLYDNVLSKLTHPESAFNWNKAFEKHRNEFLDFLSADEVIANLRIDDLKDRVKLLQRVINILDKEGFVVADNPAVVKSWLKEVIDRNSIQGIFFIWDEFTDYFRNNDQVSSLNDVAQATGEISFYLFLVTHRSIDQFQRIDAETRRKIQERFHNFHFEMKPVTAYQLVGHAIHSLPSSQEDWLIRRESLWGRIKNLTISLLGDEARAKDFEALVPLHPFSAFMLAKISSQFSSSQRTLFKFLKGDDEYSFASFLSDYPQNDWLWFTADGLWDYFFREDQSEFTEGLRDIIGYYNSRIELLEEDQQRRVFKALMLLMALWRQVGVEGLLRPTINNLKLIFVDTPVFGNLKGIVKNFCERGFIHEVPFQFNNEEFTIPLMTTDPRKLEEIRKGFLDTSPFETAVIFFAGRVGELGSRLERRFASKNLPGSRQKLTVISAKDLRTKRERVLPPLLAFQFGIVLVVPQEEEQLGDLEKLIGELAKNSTRTAYVVIQTPFGMKRWEDYVNQYVLLKYCEEVRDTKNLAFHRTRAYEILDEWVRIVQQGKQRIYFGDNVTETTDMLGYEKELEQMVEIIFPYGPEKISKLNTLYRTSGWGRAGAEIGLGIGKNITAQYKNLVDDIEAFEKADGFSKKPEHPLSKMRQIVNNLFSKDQSTRLKDIWDRLQENPFGLMPSYIGTTLLGFILKEYAHGYYWSDGVNSFALNPDKLAELIEAVLKQKKGSDAYEIRKMAPEHEQLCTLLREVFELPPEKTGFPEEAKKEVRNYFTHLGYPIWALYCIPEEIEKTYILMRPALEKLDHWLSVPDEDISGSSQTFIKDLVTAFDDSGKHLRRAGIKKFTINKEHFKLGMWYFSSEKQPELLAILDHLGLQLQGIMPLVRDMMNEEVWLWKAYQVESCLPELLSKFEFLDALNQLCGIKKLEAREALQYFRTRWLSGRTKLPPCIHAETAEEGIGSILSQLCELATYEVKEYKRCFELSKKVKENKEKIRNAVSNAELALICWIQKHLQADITPQEAQEILAKLPDLSQQDSVNELERQIRIQIDAMGRRKLSRQVKEQWKTITKSDSPEAWSEEHRIPISWVQEGPTFDFLFSVVNRAEGKSEADLQSALELMEQHNGDLSILSDEELVTERFLKTAAGEYRALIQDPSDFNSFKNHLYQRLKGPVMNWPMKLGELREAVKEWIVTFYRGRAYQRVVQAIESMPEADAKGFLRKLAEDPFLGSLLLQKSSEISKRS